MTDVPVVHFAPRYGWTPRLVQVPRGRVMQDGEELIALPVPGREREGEALLLARDSLMVAELFDGSRDLRDIQRTLHAQTGQHVQIEHIHALAMALFKAGLLTSD